MKCPNCGFENVEDAKFCEVCGMPLSGETESEPEAPAAETPEIEEAPTAEAKDALEAEQAVEEIPAEETPQAYTAPETEQPVSQEEAAPKKRNLKLPLIIGGCVVAALLIAFLVFRLAMHTPLRMVAEGFGNSAKAIQSEAIIKTANSVLQHGGVTVQVDGKHFGEAIDYDEIDGSAVVDISTNLKDMRCAVSAEVYAGSSKLADALVWAGEDSIGASSPALLGNTAYGVNLKKIKSTLPASVFNPENDTDYAIPEELYETLMNTDDASATTRRLLEEGKDTAKSAARALERTLKKNADIQKSNETLTFSSKDEKVTAVKLTFDDQALFAIVMDMLDWAKDDAALKTLITDADTQWEELIEDYFGDSLTEQFEDFLEEAYDDEDELEEELEDWEISVVFYISKSGKQLVGIDFSADIDGEKGKCSVKIGPDLASPDEISFSYKDRWDKYSGEYVVKERSSKLYEASLRLKEDKNTIASGSISWDKKAGDLKISLDDTIKLKGTMLKKGASTTLELRSLSYSTYRDTYEIKNPGVVLTLKENAKYPTIPEYKDLLLYTDEEEFEEMLDDLSDSIFEAAFSLAEELDLY